MTDLGAGVEKMPSGKIPGFVPRAPRADVDLDATITPARGEPIDARVRNLSLSGFFALCSAPIAIGSRITVSSSLLGPLPAQVRWALGARVVALFEGELSEDAASAIRALLAPATDESPADDANRVEPA